MGQRDFEIAICSLQLWIYWNQALRNATQHLSADPFITHNHLLLIVTQYTCTQSVACLTFNKILKFLLYLPCYWTSRDQPTSLVTTQQIHTFGSKQCGIHSLIPAILPLKGASLKLSLGNHFYNIGNEASFESQFLSLLTDQYMTLESSWI